MWTNQGKGELSSRPCYRTEIIHITGLQRQGKFRFII